MKLVIQVSGADPDIWKEGIGCFGIKVKNLNL